MKDKSNITDFLFSTLIGLSVLLLLVKPVSAKFTFSIPKLPYFSRPTITIPRPTIIKPQKPQKPCFLGKNCNPTLTPTLTPSPTVTPSMTPTPTQEPQQFYVVSNNTWKYSDNLLSGWTDSNFDDSNWSNVVTPSAGLCSVDAILPEGRLKENGAEPMWGANPTNHATIYFRKTFNLPYMTNGIARWLFDDDGEVYINGIKVHEEYDGHVSGILTLDVSPYLTSGLNVIALKVVDTYGGCQNAQFELKTTPK